MGDDRKQMFQSWRFGDKRKPMFQSKELRRVDDLSFFEYLSPFCFLSIEFHCTFSLLIKYYHILFVIILFWLGSDRLSGLFSFVPALLFSILTPLFCPSLPVPLSYFSLCRSDARVFGKTLVHEFPISYSHTEWYFLISLFGAREYKHAQRTLL